MAQATRKPLTGTALRKFLKGLTLLHGSHTPDGQFCVMEASAYIAGEAWSDQPKCVSPVIGNFMRSWNDGMNNDDRQMLKPYVVKVLNTKASAAVERKRSYMALDWTCRVSAPTWLRAAKLADIADELEALPPITDAESARHAQATLDRARERASAAGAAAGAAARAAAWDAAGDAAWAAAGAAAGVAAGDAAGAAAWAAAWEALRPSVEALQRSALELLDRMIAVGEAA